jgi:putative restriction endonuclease
MASRNLIGVDADFRIHVAKRLLTQNDGPLLETLKKLHLGKLHLPNRQRDRPDRDRLAIRFDEFRGYE